MKKNIIITISILIILGIMTVGLISIFNEKPRISGDSLVFKEEYEIINGKYYADKNILASNVEIEKDNPFIYLSENEIIDKLTNGTHIIYFGEAECGFSRRVVPLLSSFAEKNRIETIYYFNVKNFQSKYEEVIKTINVDKIITPTVIFIKEGKIVGIHISLLESYTDYNIELTQEQTDELINIYQNYYDLMFANICDESDC